MERCPNCGAPARPGAKFCTTCGYRLPVTAPVTSSDSDDTATANPTAAWPPPPAETPTEDEAQAPSATGAESTAEDFVVARPAPADAEAPAESDSTATTARTDSFVSSSWPSAGGTSQPSPWAVPDATPDDELEPAAGDETSPDDTGAGQAATADVDVTEETVVVAAPASRDEAWSAAVVEETVSAPSDQGTPLARATALVDELRLLLPVLNAGASTDLSEAVADELAAALSGASGSSSDRDALRAALNEARDNPRDIQTILALSQQADAAIALLDDYDKLTDAVQRAVDALRPEASSG